MAPPIPGLRRPAPATRSAGDVLAGFAAVAALAVLIVGVPLALCSLFGLPLPHSRPTVSLLTQQLGTLAIVRIITGLVWLAWLQLVWCVIAEVIAAARNVGMPARVPLAGGSQALAHRLVTAALLLFSATAALSPAIAHQPSPAPAVADIAAARAPAVVQPVQAAGQAGAPRAQASARPAAHKVYMVRPPVGRFHESLWEIAQNHLGDGRRYREIFELNKDRLQPDGTRLTIASLIRPGWTLAMPADAQGPGIETVRTAATGEPAAAAVPAGTAAASAGQAADVSISSLQRAAPARHSAPIPFPYELAGASLMAAGLLAALGRRRREQLWQRAFGRRVSAPAPEAAIAEEALRIGAAEPSARQLDRSLRQLSAALSSRDSAVPDILTARLENGQLDLRVAPADTAPPAPWTAAEDGQVWRLAADAAGRLTPGSPAAPLAPLPGLVSVGTDGSGRVLVDLEAAPGLIAVTGPAGQVQAALAAIAVELGTNLWSDSLEVVLVGFGEELAAIAPDRIRSVPSLAGILPELEARAARVSEALAVAGVGSVLTGRCRAVHSDAWTPQYVIMAEPPAQADRDRLLQIARSRHTTAAGYLVAGDVPGAAWTWEVSAGGRLRAGLLGLDVQAQLLPQQQYRAVAELFRSAAEPARTPARTPAADIVPPAQLVPGAVLPVEVCLLGPVSVYAPGTIEADRVALTTEIVAYLATHPAGVHPNVLTSAIWPLGTTAEVADAALARVGEWLGTDRAGQPRLVTGTDGRLRLGPEVRVDWNMFRALAAAASQDAARGGTGEAGLLERALDEVGGPLLDGRSRSRYAWLATSGLESEVSALVADTAHRLAGLRRAAGDPAGAMDAVRAGMRLAFDDELLRRDLLMAARETGDQGVLRGVVGEITARAAADPVLARLAPETESLIDELLPSWRMSVA